MLCFVLVWTKTENFVIFVVVFGDFLLDTDQDFNGSGSGRICVLKKVCSESVQKGPVF